MSIPARELNRRYTWEDYRSWDDDQRWELIGGEIYAMSPAPATRHQRLVGRLYQQLADFFGGRPCEVLLSPCDVKLSNADVAQPDLLVVCDPKQVTETHVEGPPTLVVEILSPSSLQHDRIRKLRLYAAFGVREYWIVNPYPSIVEVLSLAGDTFRVAGAYAKQDTLTSPAFPDLRVELATVFTFEISPEEHIDEIREATPPYPPGGPTP